MQLGARVRQAIRLSLLLSYPSFTPLLLLPAAFRAPWLWPEWKPIEKEVVRFLG